MSDGRKRHTIPGKI